jgi:PAS domain S-box-containing protein
MIPEEENSAMRDRTEDALFLGQAAEIIYQTEDSVLLIDQILERISKLKDIPFSACLEQGVNGLIVEGFYASFTAITKNDISLSFSEDCSETLQTSKYLIFEKSDFESNGFSFELFNQTFTPTSALIIPCFCKGIYNRYFVFLDNSPEGNRFQPIHRAMQHIVKLAAERLVNIFMYGELNRLNNELDRRVKERTEELTLTNKSLNREINERKVIEKALRANERKLRSVYNAAIDVSFITFDLTENYIIRSFSPGAEQMFGFSAHEVTGKPLELVQLLNSADFFNSLRNDFDAIGWSRQEEIVMRRKSGEDFTAMLTVYPLFDEDLRILDALAVCIDISELKETQNQLIKALEKAEENDRLKTSFLQNMSHEIRTPLNAILGFADLLPEYFSNKATLKRYTGIIKQKGTDLLGIINDILDVACIESGQILVNPENFRLDRIFVEMECLFRDNDNPKSKMHVDFDVHVSDQVRNMEVVIDQLKLKQILINLIENAFKFTSSGRIELGCSLSGQKELLFHISDTGIGISSEKHTEIFKRFTRASHDTTQFYGGTGLGLSIVKGLLDLMDGKIWLESKVGLGSTFYFTLPFTTAADHYEPVQSYLSYNSFGQSDATILIVDNDEYNSQYLMEVLRESGFSILHCIYGEKAIEICRIQEIQIVLMDVRLPDTDGYEVIGKIKQFNQSTKIIVQTAYASNDDKIRAFDAGCDDYLSKPIKHDVLVSKIRFYQNHFKHLIQHQ